MYIKYSASLENYSWLSFFFFYGQPSSRVKEREVVIRRAKGLRKVEARIVSSDDFRDKSKGKEFWLWNLASSIFCTQKSFRCFSSPSGEYDFKSIFKSREIDTGIINDFFLLLLWRLLIRNWKENGYI